MSHNEGNTPRAKGWKPSRCKVNGFVEYRLERQTGPCLRDDYEFAVGADGRPLAFSSYEAAEAAIRAIEDQRLVLELA